MYPVIRTISIIAQAFAGKKLAPDAVSEIEFVCRPWDLDMFFEMNNGRVLTLFDVGRFDLVVRTGFVPVMRRRRWGFAVAGSSVRYRKRITAFQRVKLRTQIAGIDKKWFYVAQSMWVNGQPTSSVVLRTCVTSNGRAVPTREALSEMGLMDWQRELPAWIDAWSEADIQRPWPPQP